MLGGWPVIVWRWGEVLGIGFGGWAGDAIASTRVQVPPSKIETMSLVLGVRPFD